CPSWELLRGREGMARVERRHHTPSAPCALAFSQTRRRFVISSSSPWWSGAVSTADRDLPVTGGPRHRWGSLSACPSSPRPVPSVAPTVPSGYHRRGPRTVRSPLRGPARRSRPRPGTDPAPPRDRRAPPPLGIAFRVSLVAPPRSVRGPDGAEWVPSAGTSNGPLSAPRPRPTISAPARDGSGAVPSPSPRCSPLPQADRDP